MVNINVEEIKEIINNLDGGQFKNFINQDKIFELKMKITNGINQGISEEDIKEINDYERLLGVSPSKIERETDCKEGYYGVRTYNADDPEDMTAIIYTEGTNGILSKKLIESIFSREYEIYMIYHNDLDGDVSASIIYNLFKNDLDDIHTYRWNYSEKLMDEFINSINMDKIHLKKSGKKMICFLCDLSPNQIVMNGLITVFDKIIWVDHHSTSIQTAISMNKVLKKKNINFVIDKRFCASYLVWQCFEHYFTEYFNKHIGGLQIVSLVNMYDLKLDKLYPEAYHCAECINQGFWDYAAAYAFNNFYSYGWKNWNEMKDSDYLLLGMVLNVGEQLIELDRQKKKIMYDNDFIYHYEIPSVTFYKKFNIGNIRFNAIYGYGSVSRFINANKIDTNEVNMLIRYTNDNRTASISIYTDSELIKKYNLGKICNYFGIGGGHAGAAGCSLNKTDIAKAIRLLDFESIEKNADLFKFDSYEFNNIKLEHSIKKCIPLIKEKITKLSNVFKQQMDIPKLSPRYEEDVDRIFRLIIRLIWIYMYHTIIKEEEKENNGI